MQMAENRKYISWTKMQIWEKQARERKPAGIKQEEKLTEVQNNKQYCAKMLSLDFPLKEPDSYKNKIKKTLSIVNEAF